MDNAIQPAQLQGRERQEWEHMLDFLSFACSINRHGAPGAIEPLPYNQFLGTQLLHAYGNGLVGLNN